MGQKEKLIKRLKTKPRDFTFDEAETLLGYLTYSRSNKGKTSGSRVMFTSEQHAPILLHKQAAICAMAQQVSLNTLVEDALREYVAERKEAV